MQKLTALEKLYALREVLDRLSRTDTTLYEALAHDVEEAITLTDDCIAALSDDSPEDPEPAGQSGES